MQADLRTFGITPESILERARNGGKPDEAYITMMKYQIERARAYYAQAEAGIALLAPGAQVRAPKFATIGANRTDSNNRSTSNSNNRSPPLFVCFA